MQMFRRTDGWLSANEAASLNAMRFPKRRDDWRLGRWTAKNALAFYFLSLKVRADPQVLASLEIRQRHRVRPEVFFRNKPAAATISLSHRSRNSCVRGNACSSAALGCDLEIIEPRSEAFISDYFTSAEQSLVAEASAVDRLRLLALLWSAKESALKALHEGLRIDTRDVIVSPGDAAFDFDGWSPIVVRHIDRRIFCGWWQHADGMVRTLVAAPPPNPPTRLRIPDYVSDAGSLCA